MTPNKGMVPWFLQRLTALFLVLGLIVHFVVLHFMIERPVTIEKVAERLKNPGWIVFDSILLIACLYHALNGVNSIILDFKPTTAFLRFICYFFWIAGIATAVVGIANLIPFWRN